MVAKELVLGFIGTGESSARNTYALLSDYVDSHGPARFIVPITAETWTESLQAVVEFAAENEIPLEAVIDGAKADKVLEAWRSRALVKHSVTLPYWKIVESVSAASRGALVVFWNPEGDAEAEAAIKHAWAEEVTILDLTAGLAPVEVVEGTEQTKEQKLPTQELTAEALAAMDDAEIEKLADEAGIDHQKYATWDEVRALLVQEPEAAEQTGGGSEITREWLESLTEEELERLADSLNIDHTKYSTWEEVIVVILDQHGSPAGGGEALPTAEDLEDWGFEQLKAFAEEHGIEVAPRTKSPGYRTAIVDWLANQPEAGGEDVNYDAVADLGPITESLRDVISKVDRVLDALGNLGVNLDKKLDEFAMTLDAGLKDVAALNGGTPPTTGVKKASTSAKAAAPANTTTKAAAPAKKAAPAKATGSTVKAGLKRAGAAGKG